MIIRSQLGRICTGLYDIQRTAEKHYVVFAIQCVLAGAMRLEIYQKALNSMYSLRF